MATTAAKFDAHQVITDRLIALMEQGVAPWRREWDAAAGLPKSISTGKAYRGINPFLLWMTAMEKEYTSPWWATYKKITELGGQVRKGEKGTLIVFWKQYLDKKEVDDKGKPVSRFVLRTYTVFNAEQADGLDPKYTTAAERPADYDPIAEAEQILAGYLTDKGPSVRYGGDRACYSPTTDDLSLPERGTFNSVEAFYSTAFHEITHSTGHKDRLNREDLNTFTHFGDASYSREELVAEFGAAMLSGQAGIAAVTIENSAAYLAGWIKALKGDKTLLIGAAGKAQKAADLVLGVTFADDKAAPVAA